MGGLLLFLVAAAGLGLLVRGIRGRAVGEEPRCAACGYDLSGVEGPFDRCSECGADLRLGRAVAWGRRRRRPWMAFAGAVVLLFAGTIGFAVAAVATGEVNPAPYKPAWLLLREARGRNLSTAEAALLELMEREAAGRLSDADGRRLARVALAAVAAGNRGGAPSVHDAFLQQYQSGRVGEEDLGRYLEAIAPAVRLHRARVAPGAWVEIVCVFPDVSLRRWNPRPDLPRLEIGVAVHPTADSLPAFHRSEPEAFASGRMTLSQTVAVFRAPDSPGTHTLAGTLFMRVSTPGAPDTGRAAELAVPFQVEFEVEDREDGGDG